MSRFDTLLQRLQHCLSNPRFKRIYPDNAFHKEHHLMAYDIDGNLLAGERKWTPDGVTAASLAAYDPARTPELGKRQVAYIAHRLYKTDVVTLRWDGAVKITEWPSPLTRKFADEFAPSWARPYWLTRGQLPAGAKDNYAERCYHVLQVDGVKRRVLSTDLWLRSDGVFVYPEEPIGKGRTTLQYEVTVLTDEAKRWRRENKAVLMRQYVDATSLCATMLASGMTRTMFIGDFYKALEQCGIPQDVAKRMTGVVGQLPAFEKFVDDSTFIELGYFGMYEKADREREL